MSQNEQGSSKSKLPTAAIKIAATDGSKSGNNGQPTPDVGPGDPAAAPSVAPELVDVPDPPTASQLVVKSTSPSSVSRDRSAKEVSGTPMGPSASVGYGAGVSSGYQTKTSTGSKAKAKVGSGSGPKPDSGPESGGSAESAGSGPEPGPESQESGSRSVSNVTSGVPPSDFAPSAASSVSPKPVSSKPASSKPASSKPASSKHVSPKRESPKHSSPNQDNNKVTKFRYHRRVTVHTTGKVNPDGILDKVTPQNLEDLNPEELMKKTGIKANNQTHWRIRLRQTKRLTKGGKTTTQTKVAYRDSDGNIRKEGGSNSERFCKRCEKKLEECKCDTSSAHR